MTSLETLLARGRQYLAQLERIERDVTLTVEHRQELAIKHFRLHSGTVRDVPIDDADALLASFTLAIKWHERQARDGGHLNDCLQALEDAQASLQAHLRAEAEPELPLERAA